MQGKIKALVTSDSKLENGHCHLSTSRKEMNSVKNYNNSK